MDMLCTIDVSSLYPSIPHEDGLNALGYYLEQRQDLHLTPELLLSLTDIVLAKNSFRSQDCYYPQCRGIAMGSPVAPNYANLFMGKYKKDFIYNNNPFSIFIKSYSEVH